MSLGALSSRCRRLISSLLHAGSTQLPSKEHSTEIGENQSDFTTGSPTDTAARWPRSTPTGSSCWERHPWCEMRTGHFTSVSSWEDQQANPKRGNIHKWPGPSLSKPSRSSNTRKPENLSQPRGAWGGVTTECPGGSWMGPWDRRKDFR